MNLNLKLFLVFLLAGSFSFAAHIPESKARLVAESFLANRMISTHSVAEDISQAILDNKGNIALYIIALKPAGFILVSADDASYPVPGYSLESNYLPNQQPENFKAWLKGYTDQISFAISENIQPDQKTGQTWDAYLNGSNLPPAKGPSTAVAPLLTSTWDQGAPYKYLCPADAGGS